MHSHQSTPLIRLEGITMRRDRRTVLSDVNLNVYKGDFLAVTGPNGGGKTTLLRIMLRLLAPTSGSVSYFGADGKSGSPLRIGYLPQKNAIDSRFPISVRQVIASGLGGHMAPGLSNSEKTEMIDEMINRVELHTHAGSPIGEISGGQLQRALLGRALIASPEVLVLDEPLSYLDRHFEQKLYDELAVIAPETTIVLVSHEMTRIAGMASRHVVIDHTLRECHYSSHAVHYDCQG